MKRSDAESIMYSMYHEKGMEIVSQVDQFLKGACVYRNFFHTSTVTITNGNKSLATNRVLTLKLEYSTIKNTSFISGETIRRDSLKRANFVSSDLCSG